MIFIDRSIGRPVALALQQVRDDVLWLEDRYPANTLDVTWLEHAGVNNWLVVTRDKRIRYKRYEIASLREHKVGCFVLGEQRDLSKWNLLKLLVTHLDEMGARHAATERPFLFLIDGNGAFRRIV